MSNPFEVLKLDPTASAEEVVRQAGRLRQRLADETAAAEVRRAAQALTGSPEERRLHELLAHPEPYYRWPALEAFVAAFRRPPDLAGRPALASDCPSLSLDEVAILLRPLVAEALDGPPLTFDPIGDGEDVEEIRRQTVEGLWQVLPFDATLS